MLEARDGCLAAKTCCQKNWRHAAIIAGERMGPRACPCFLLAPRPPLAGGGGAGLEETVVSSCEVPAPGSWAPEAGPGFPGQEAGGGVAHGVSLGTRRMGSPHRDGVA